MGGCRFLLSAVALFAASALADSGKPRIAIIIDDLGYARAAGERAIRLPGPIAFAVLPYAPRARYLAERAHTAGKEILLHLPMQADVDAELIEPGGLSLDMSRTQFSKSFANSVESVPHIVGVNSHRGSLLTRHPGHMSWLMDELWQRRGLFFIDSYTTAQSIAVRIARENSVPAVKRDVFLDSDTDPAMIAYEFSRLKKIAVQQGFAVGIGHPYPTTLAFLEESLPSLEIEGFELIAISRLVAMQPRFDRRASVSAE